MKHTRARVQIQNKLLLRSAAVQNSYNSEKGLYSLPKYYTIFKNVFRNSQEENTMKIKTKQVPYEVAVAAEKPQHLRPKKPSMLFRALVRRAARFVYSIKLYFVAYNSDLRRFWTVVSFQTENTPYVIGLYALCTFLHLLVYFFHGLFASGSVGSQPRRAVSFSSIFIGVGFASGSFSSLS